MLAASIKPYFESWRETARQMLVRDVAPDRIFWADGSDNSCVLPEMFETHVAQNSAPGMIPRVPSAFIASARMVSLHRDPNRWGLLYRLLYRLTHGEHHLLKITIDDDVARLTKMEKHVRRDIHKMHAFVRFRLVKDERGEHFIAWHRPDHFIVPNVGPWFAKRFPTMRWTILTPDASVVWDLQELQYGPGFPASAGPQGDDLEALWKTYYASIFNPARVKTKAMKKEMPVLHWATLPEAQLIDDLLRQAKPRVEAFMHNANASAKRHAKVPII